MRSYRTLNVDTLFMDRRMRDRQPLLFLTGEGTTALRLFPSQLPPIGLASLAVTLSTVCPKHLMRRRCGEPWKHC